MRRRAFVATAGTVALAGCTASGDEGGMGLAEYTVSGIESSGVYNGYTLSEGDNLFSTLGLNESFVVLSLHFDAAADYDPLEHEVLLLDRHETLDGGYENLRVEYDGKHVSFDLMVEAVERGGPYRVVSKDPAGIVDEFELEIVRTGSDSDA